MAGVHKSKGFTQSPTGVPKRRSEGGYGAGAFADSHAYNTILEGTLNLHNGDRIALEYDDGDGLGTETQVNSKEELALVAPPGTDQLTLETVHQGTRTVSLNVPADAFPSVPEFIHLTTRDTATWLGSTVVVAFSRVTQTRIMAAGTVQKPELTLTPTADGRWSIRVTGDVGINYVLEATSQLGAGWEGVTNFRMMGGSFDYIDGALRQHRFYRVREGF